MIFWDDVPITGVQFHTPDAQSGWWPVVEFVLDAKTYQKMPHLKEIALVICVYQLMWKELVAWPIPVQKILCHCLKAGIICILCF